MKDVFKPTQQWNSIHNPPRTYYVTAAVTTMWPLLFHEFSSLHLRLLKCRQADSDFHDVILICVSHSLLSDKDSNA